MQCQLQRAKTTQAWVKQNRNHRAFEVALFIRASAPCCRGGCEINFPLVRGIRSPRSGAVTADNNVGASARIAFFMGAKRVAYCLVHAATVCATGLPLARSTHAGTERIIGCCASFFLPSDWPVWKALSCARRPTQLYHLPHMPWIRKRENEFERAREEQMKKCAAGMMNEVPGRAWETYNDFKGVFCAVKTRRCDSVKSAPFNFLFSTPN
jgi:hypothetical protein